MTGARRRVLVVEDDQAMSIALRDGFAYEGWEVSLARDGAAALRLAHQSCPDIMILDVMLPGINGFDLCKRFRAEGSRVGIIMLSARSQEIDKVLGLRLGADDYITKPFSFMELLARVEAVLRRSGGGAGSGEEAGCHRIGEVTVDFGRHEARRGEQRLEMSPRELALLAFLVRHRGQVVTRDQLLEAVWGWSSLPFTRTVDTHVAKLRKKIEPEPADPRWLVTVHRLGYKLVG